MDLEARVHPFARTEAQIQQLRECCTLWQSGPERFWAFDDVLAALSRSGSVGFFAAPSESGVWQGMVLADVGPFSADLLYIFVKTAHRRAGVGRALIAALAQELRRRPQLEALFLEVRASNAGAQALYRALGMEQIGTRKAYYRDGEDALVLKLALPEAP